jgi:molybdopterin-containing oxidoreductase family membrane subunit
MVGAFGLFFTLFLLFCRYLPMIAMAEVKAVMPQADPHGAGAGKHGHHGHGHSHAHDGQGHGH